MSIVGTGKIGSFRERKIALHRAAELISSGEGCEREFQMLFNAIVEFDIAQDRAPIEIPLGFTHFLRAANNKSDLKPLR